MKTAYPPLDSQPPAADAVDKFRNRSKAQKARYALRQPKYRVTNSNTLGTHVYSASEAIDLARYLLRDEPRKGVTISPV